jgi:hypothetical protein
MSAKAKGAAMSENAAVSPENAPTPSTPHTHPAAQPTGYRISILPAALEISARLATSEELQSLVKILQANAAIWATSTKAD